MASKPSSKEIWSLVIKMSQKWSENLKIFFKKDYLRKMCFQETRPSTFSSVSRHIETDRQMDKPHYYTLYYTIHAQTHF